MRRRVTRVNDEWEVEGSDFTSMDKVLAEAVAKELDQIDPLRNVPDFEEARQRLYDLCNLAVDEPLTDEQQDEFYELVPIVERGLADEAMRHRAAAIVSRTRNAIVLHRLDASPS